MAEIHSCGIGPSPTISILQDRKVALSPMTLEVALLCATIRANGLLKLPLVNWSYSPATPWVAQKRAYIKNDTGTYTILTHSPEGTTRVRKYTNR